MADPSHLFLRLFLIFMFPLLGSGMSRIETGGGVVLQGDILAEKNDRIIVDLGFSVISIPREVIVRIGGTGFAGYGRSLSGGRGGGAFALGDFGRPIGPGGGHGADTYGTRIGFYYQSGWIRGDQ